jgi:hypothetical protein
LVMSGVTETGKVSSGSLATSLANAESASSESSCVAVVTRWLIPFLWDQWS